MRTSRFPVLPVSVALVGGMVVIGGTVTGTVAELHAQRDKENIVRGIVATVTPGAEVSHLDIHGRPLFLGDGDSVSTAYLDVTSEHRNMQWIIENYRDNVIDRLEMFVPVTLPADPATGKPVQPGPVTDADGAFTDRGSVGGTVVTYAASVDNGDLVITADGVAVTRIASPTAAGSSGTTVTSTFVTDNGLTVNLETRSLRV